MSTPKISRLSGNRDWIDLDFVERERTPEPAIALGIQSRVAGLSLSNTVDLLDALGVHRSRKAVHDWVQKAEIQPELGRPPNQIALDETVIRINDQQFWLYTAADPARTNCFTSASFQRRQPLLPRSFCANCARNTMSKLRSFSLMALNTSKPHCNELDSDFRRVATEIATLSNGSFES